VATFPAFACFHALVWKQAKAGQKWLFGLYNPRQQIVGDNPKGKTPICCEQIEREKPHKRKAEKMPVFITVLLCSKVTVIFPINGLFQYA